MNLQEADTCIYDYLLSNLATKVECGIKKWQGKVLRTDWKPRILTSADLQVALGATV